MTRPITHGPLPRDLAEATDAELLAAREVVRAAIDAAYWRFTRGTSVGPVPGYLYAHRAWLDEAIRRRGCARRAA